MRIFHCIGRRICQNAVMRLTPTEQQVIRDASLRYFGVRPRLFGSRVDDALRQLARLKLEFELRKAV